MTALKISLGGCSIALALLLAPSALAATSPCGEHTAAPPQAQAAGFTKRVFDYDFSTLDVAPSESGGKHAWWTVPPLWQRTPPNWRSAYTLSGQAVTLTTRADEHWPETHLISNISNSSGQNEPQNGSFLHGYFEACLKFQMPVGAWPAFWLFSSKHLATANPRDWSEIDIVEGQADTPRALYFTLHWWEDQHRNHQNPNPQVALDAAMDPTQFHRYGLLWVPGAVTWYVDGKPVLKSPTWPINDRDPLSIIISAQANGWGPKNNANISGVRAISVDAGWVSVWQ